MSLKIYKILKFLTFSIFLIFISFNNSTAQKFRIGYGVSVLTDVSITSHQKPPGLNLKSDDFQTTLGISPLSLSAEMKYNLHEFSPNLAISVASSPGLGLSSVNPIAGKGGFGNVRVPVYIQFDSGCLSTRETDASIGFSIGIGYQLDSYGIFSKNKSLSFGSAAARFAVNYYNAYHHLRAIALKVGIPKTITSRNTYESQKDQYGKREEYELDVDTRIAFIQLSWIFYFHS